ncbi:hypothetical protein [Mucilaginibacter sp. OK283]|jgi:hypothetical protein|uniref:hypothetical protein n=1 Tax=Mucilaginibacter sp. OK283 TaxID=1881049 RepID=UPI0008D5B48F|nr:hypothetical protein [Mucilaginibacter sp. OK283]SEP37632.1 hypothetical protein SAMN05428947_1138 [Mucilaginibacter sp. OK283]
MEYLIATIVIMLFCITALAQERSSESAIIISRDNPKPLKPGKEHAKRMTKHICLPAFTDLPKFTGLLCLDVVPINGDRALTIYLPAWYGNVTVPQSSWANRYQRPSAVGIATETGGYIAILPQFKLVNLFGKALCFAVKKLQLS